MLTRHFLQQSARQLGVEPKRISDAALARLVRFGFPGNVRQLENVCHWLTVMAPAQMIEPKDLPPEIDPAHEGEGAHPAAAGAAVPVPPVVSPGIAVAGVPADALQTGDWEPGLQAEAMALLASGRLDVWDELTRRFERKLILTALEATRGRRIEAAHKLGIGRNTITRKIQELGIEDE